MLVFMCRDPGDAISKVSRCVEPSYCFKNSYFDTIANLLDTDFWFHMHGE